MLKLVRWLVAKYFSYLILSMFCYTQSTLFVAGSEALRLGYVRRYVLNWRPIFKFLFLHILLIPFNDKNKTQNLKLRHNYCLYKAEKTASQTVFSNEKIIIKQNTRNQI